MSPGKEDAARHDEFQYLDLVRKIIDEGNVKVIIFIQTLNMG